MQINTKYSIDDQLYMVIPNIPRGDEQYSAIVPVVVTSVTVDVEESDTADVSYCVAQPFSCEFDYVAESLLFKTLEEAFTHECFSGMQHHF